MLDQLKWLTDSVLDPIKARVLRMSWGYRTAILLVLAGTVILIQYHDQVATNATGASRIVRVVLGPQNRIPLSANDRDRLGARLKRLASILWPKLSQPERDIAQAWSTAQVAVAVAETRDFIKTPAIAYMESQMDPNCFCWEQFYKPNEPHHVAASAWILIAFARLNQPARKEQLQFLLKTQLDDGAWPIFEFAAPEEASAYATSLAVLALHQQLGAGFVPKELESAIKVSMERGRMWLMTYRIGGKARWADYPRGTHGPHRELDSLGLSGQVLHVLHRIGQSGLIDVDGLWLQSLPAKAPGGGDFDASNREIYDPKGAWIQNDSSRYFALPWSIVATVDAYPDGTTIERTKALALVEGGLAGVEGAESEANAWGEYATAELLIALSYLARHTVGLHSEAPASWLPISGQFSFFRDFRFTLDSGSGAQEPQHDCACRKKAQQEGRSAQRKQVIEQRFGSVRRAGYCA